VYASRLNRQKHANFVKYTLDQQYKLKIYKMKGGGGEVAVTIIVVQFNPTSLSNIEQTKAKKVFLLKIALLLKTMQRCIIFYTLK
jgi:hypothetical protein